eukprot:361278-Chlamydomonas_euryale.AAC.3
MRPSDVVITAPAVHTPVSASVPTQLAPFSSLLAGGRRDVRLRVRPVGRDDGLVNRRAWHIAARRVCVAHGGTLVGQCRCRHWQHHGLKHMQRLPRPRPPVGHRVVVLRGTGRGVLLAERLARLLSDDLLHPCGRGDRHPHVAAAPCWEGCGCSSCCCLASTTTATSQTWACSAGWRRGVRAPQSPCPLPLPSAPQPAIPKPATPQPATLNRSTPRPAQPQPATPQPATPQPTAAMQPFLFAQGVQAQIISTAWPVDAPCGHCVNPVVKVHHLDRLMASGCTLDRLMASGCTLDRLMALGRCKG